VDQRLEDGGKEAGLGEIEERSEAWRFSESDEVRQCDSPRHVELTSSRDEAPSLPGHGRKGPRPLPLSELPSRLMSAVSSTLVLVSRRMASNVSG
jgi:hypothetical protein